MMINMPGEEQSRENVKRRIRYAVVGLGHFAQASVLPAFERAAENSELAALVSDEPLKYKRLAKRHRVGLTYSYSEYDACLKSGEIDAVYLAVPVDMHRDFALRAISAGIHVLCENPMALTEADCQDMISAAQKKSVRLMVAYRPRFEEGNVKAVNFCRSGKLGELRVFQAAVTTQLKSGAAGAARRSIGAFYEPGIHCINMARGLFQAEPVEVFAYQAGAEPADAERLTAALLRFPGDRLASFTVSCGASESSAFQIFGSKGSLRCEGAFDIAGDHRHVVTLGGDEKERSFEARDQSCAQLLGFSDCLLQGREPEFSGVQGLGDIRVIRALVRSAEEGRPVKLAAEPAKAPAAVKTALRRPALAA